MKNWKKIGICILLVLFATSSLAAVPRRSAALGAPACPDSSCVNNGSNSNSASTTINPNQITYNGVSYVPIGAARPTTLYGNKANAQTCFGGSVVVFDYNTGDGTVYKVTTAVNIGASLKAAAPQVASFLSSAPNGDCFIQGAGGTAITVDDKGVGQTTVDSPNADKGQACFQNSTGSPLTWLLCPILDAASGMTNAMVRLFEDQLSFKVNQLGNVKDQTSGAYKTYKAWSFIRIVGSILLVVVILVMVISQAVGWGPFDAYTVRKLIPKLIAAVILMQISWTVFAWVVDVVDDIGRGLADLMFAPFGGASNLDLWHLLANAKLSSGLLGALDWGGVIGLAFLGVAFPFTMLGVALLAVLSILAGLMTLIFRKILIIMALVISPLALVMWILPGTDRYWKLWKDNFTKALLMFPLAILIITSGRIFAYIAGTQDNSQLLNLIFILAGFFLPLFILPKTYQWGGSAMKLAGDAAMKASKKVGEKPKQLLDTRQESWSQLRKGRAADRYAHPEKYKDENNRYRLSSYWNRPLDKMRAGDYDPTLGAKNSELRTRQRNRFLAEAEEHEAKSRQEGLARFTRLEENLSEGGIKDEDGNVITAGGNKDDMYQDVLRLARGEAPLKKYYNYDKSEIDLSKVMGGGERNAEVGRRAALDRMVQLGADTNWTHIDAEDERIQRYGTAGEKANWRKFLNDNKDQVLEKMPDMLKGVGSVADISAEGIARMHGAGIKRMISKLDHDATDVTRAGETEEQAVIRRDTGQKRLTKFLTTYSEALNNSNLRGHLEQGGLRAVKAYVTSKPAERKYLLEEDPYKMHTDPEDGRMVIREGTAVDAATGRVEYSGDLLLKPIIKASPDGTVTGPAAAGLDSLPNDLKSLLDNEIAPDGSFLASPRPRVPRDDRRIDTPAEAELDLHPEDRRVITPDDPAFRRPGPGDLPR